MTDTLLDGGAGDPPADPPAAPPAADPPASPPAGDPPADPPANDSGDPPAFDFNKDWRSALSKGDADLAKFLGRYQSPDSAIKKFKEINDDIKAGKYRKPLGDDASDEEKAAYRKEQGIPDKPDGYYEALPDGLVIGDDDKPYVGKFLESMHGVDAPPKMVNAALDAYYANVQEQAEAQAALIEEQRRSGEDELAQEWGADKKRNINAVKSYLATLPADVSQALAGAMAQAPDGKHMLPIGNNPAVVKWLASLALEANPLSTVVPGAGANQASAIADEIAAIEGRMRTDRSGYNKDEKMQARYRELIDAKIKLDARS
jgi:hypothetical protein